MGPAARDYAPGAVVPGTKYQVVRRIGGGGMGTVYDVEDTSIGKMYVLKALHPQLGDNEDLARRMKIEARTLARLHHTNIVEVITAGVTEDEMHLPFYVMERLNGQALSTVLAKKGQLELPHGVHIAIDLLDALDHAHDKGVIHRDVKPDNIFLHRTTAGMTVTKLLDFGIVSMLDAAKRETAGRFLGTLRYASPEQLRGENPTVKMDVYCAALVLYEMIAGRGPFDDHGDSNKIAYAHVHHLAPPVSRFVVVPKELDRLLAAALAKDPEGRPRDAFSFAQSLRNLKRTLGPQPVGETTGNRATSPSVLDAHAQPPAAPIVAVQRPAPDGPYVVSPGPVPEPRTTMRGMSAPTVGEPALAITKRPADSVDREAATHVAQQTPTPAAVAQTLPIATPAPAEAAAPMRWPSEQPPARTEEPQVRSIPAAAHVRSPRAVVMAVSAVLGLGTVAAGLLVLRHQVDQRAAPAMTASVVAAPPLPEPVVTPPAPTIALPALEDPTAPAPSAVPTPTAKPPTPRPRTSVTPKPSAAPAPAPAAPDRPGPGF